MATDTLIAWTDHTFNPWMGCSRISEGCRHCYAESLTKNRMGLSLWGVTAARQVTKSPWSHVRGWQRDAARGRTPGAYGRLPDGRTPHLVFTGSLMDWAEPRADLVEPRMRMWQIVRESPDLWFQLLTKRPDHIAEALPDDWGDGYPNVWLGTTIEDMRVAWRADALRAVPARVRFVSYEPAIGPLTDAFALEGLHWLICGGESGAGYRPFDMQWARDIRDRCVAHGVAFFMKQDAAFRTEMRPYLVEPDGSAWAWKQFPGRLTPPVRMPDPARPAPAPGPARSPIATSAAG